MWRIVDWEKNFENNRTKELKHLSWVPVPNRHDGDGYTELLDHHDGPAHYGAWCAIVQVASKCDPRGTLSRDGARPHDAASLARMTRFPVSVMAAAIERLVDPIKWLEVVPDPSICEQLTEISQEGAISPHDAAEKRLRNGTEQKGTIPDRTGNRTDFSIGKKTRKREHVSPADLVESIPELCVASGITVEPLPAKAVSGGAFAVLQEDHLGRTGDLVEWFRRQLSLPDPVCGNTEADLLLVISNGIYATRLPEKDVKKNRVAVFVDVISKNRWRKVTPFVSEALVELQSYRARKATNGSKDKQPA